MQNKQVVLPRVQSSNAADMRRLTLAQALQSKDDPHLFVINIKKPAGNINMSVKGDDGTMQPLVFHKTFIPVDMCLFINRENLLNNNVFRRLHARGDSIVIVNSEDAQRAIDNTPSAKKEMMRILSENNTYNTEEASGEYIQMKAVEGSTGASTVETLPDLNPFSYGIVQQANEGIDAADLMLDIEGRLADLTLADLEYICSNVEDPTLKQWLIDQAGNK